MKRIDRWLVREDLFYVIVPIMAALYLLIRAILWAVVFVLALVVAISVLLFCGIILHMNNWAFIPASAVLLVLLWWIGYYGIEHDLLP